MRNSIPLILVILVGVGSLAFAEVDTTVYLSEPNLILEPIEVNDNQIEYPEIMVGTKLAIVVDSNESGRWYGGLFIEGPDMEYGLLSARDYNDIDPAHDWQGSHFPAAGIGASVKYWFDADLDGFDLYADWSAIEGDWFVIDYTAIKPGPCKVRFYYYTLYPEPPEDRLIYDIQFYNVPTRDFNADKVVEIGDLALLANCWIQPTSDSNSPCFPVDLNADSWVDFNDFAMFASFWLEKTQY